MSLVAPVKDGEIQDVTTTTSSTETSSSTLDKQAFLQLLVAQMKYQDPLEPTSNTEYISQLATFSSLEEMQNMRSSMDLQRASALVGQEVYIKTTDSTTGSTDYIHGNVDYVTYENSKAYVSVNGSQYPLDDVDSVYDQNYTNAYSIAYDWTVALNKLPSLSKLTLSDEDDVTSLKSTYDDMTDYQKTFLTDDNKTKLQNYIDQISVLKKAAAALTESQETTDSAETGTGSSTSAGTTATDSVKKTTGTTETADSTKETTGTTEASDSTKETIGTIEASDSTKETTGTTEASDSTKETTGTTEAADSTEATDSAAEAAGSVEAADSAEAAETAEETAKTDAEEETDSIEGE